MDIINKESNIINFNLPAPLLYNIHNALTFALINQDKFQKEGDISSEDILTIQRLRDGLGDIIDTVNPQHPPFIQERSIS